MDDSASRGGAKERAANRSYMFFRITGLSNEGEPVGAQGVPLTPGRSIAVDRLHDYGTPFFIEADLPLASDKAGVAVPPPDGCAGHGLCDRRAGARRSLLGRRRRCRARRRPHPQSGRFVMLLPRELDMIAAGRHMPLPPPKPAFAEGQISNNDVGKHELGKPQLAKHEASKHDVSKRDAGKHGAGKHDDKRNPAPATAAIDPRAATAYARWRTRPVY